MNKEDILDAINKEIEWSSNIQNQKYCNMKPIEAEWFIKGLQQAKLIINRL